MRQNIIANFAGRLWSIISVFVFIPFYIHFLGVELYGLVSFFATMQGVIFLLDAGLSVTLRREFSYGEDTLENRIRKYKLLRSIEFVYLIILFFIITFCFFGAEFTVNKWLNVGNINTQTAINAIRLMGVSISLQFMSTLYSGGLTGLEKQVTTNLYQIAWSFLKNGCVLLILWLIKADIILFYSWFIFIDILYLTMLRLALTHEMKFDVSYKWNIHDLSCLKNVWRYAGGMLVISIISAFNFQLDKLFISKTLPIAELGVYNLAFSLSQLPVILINSIAVAIFPRFVYYFSIKDEASLKSHFLFFYRLICILGVSISVTMCFYTLDLFLLWTRNIEMSNEAWLPATILIAGSLFLTLQIIPFNLALAHGITKINTHFGIANVIVLIPLLAILVNLYGIVGAAISWFIISLIITPLYIVFVYKKLVESNWLVWILKDTVLILLFVLIVSLLFFILGKFIEMNGAVKIFYSFLTGLLTLTLTLLVFERNFISKLRTFK